MTTRERIIESAALHFARDGFRGASLREITEGAEANVAAVNYHFGSKENLLVEILDSVVGPINVERLRRLDEAEAEGDLDVTRIMTCFLLPDLEVLARLRARDPSLPRFVARMYTEGSELMGQVMGRQFAEIDRRFRKALRQALPHLTPDEIRWRLGSVVGIVVYLFAGIDASGLGDLVGTVPDRGLSRLLAFVVPMMTAPTAEGVGTRN